MKLKSLLTALFVMLATFAIAQVEDGKVYRIVSAKYGTVMSESPILHTLSCASKGTAADYHEMWQFDATDDGKFTIKNVYTQRYVQYEAGRNVQWKTGLSETKFTVTEHPSLKGYYNIDLTPTKNWGAHCDGSSNIVPWSYGEGEISGTEWTFELVNISADEIADASAAYQDYAKVLNNANAIAAKVGGLFEDNACTVLKAEWAAKSDAEVLAALEDVPADLQDVVLKIKNNAWDSVTREKEFRVYDYKPYSNPEVWADRLFTRPYNRINNPTGISTSDSKSFIYVFVEEIPEGTTIDLAEMASTKFWGNDTRLKVGLNIVPCANKDGSLYIRYICETAIDGKKLADYPTVKVHVEGGYVNGFWSKERGHTNEDWVYMRDNMFKNPTAVQAAGDLTVLNFRTYEFLKECPDNIEGVMRLWDFWNSRQNHYMALDLYDEWRNNKQLAMSDDNGFMDASAYRTHYNNNTLSTIVNYDLLVADAGSSWGPNHEIGHTNQYAFQIVGTSEVSNNALTNFAIFDQGTHVSRGNNMENQILDFENKIPYVVRGEGMYGSKLFSMTRMYFQLFLYFHAAGKDTTFYPRLFEKLRYDRLPGWATGSWDELDENGFYRNSVDASKDQLKFAEACCEIAQMDLSEFFEAWGFFIPMKNAFVGDYGHHWVYLLEEDAKASKARMQKYEKKGGHLMFLEDRVRKSPRKKSPFSDGTGYRANYADWDGETIGSVGNFGQWMDYIDETVKAQGYYYAVSKGKVVIKEAENAGGALGFKLYNAETGELLSYTNKYEMNIPVTASGATLKVVAAQADGTDYEVPHASQGPESMQKEALDGSLKSASAIIAKKATANTIVGYYYPEAIADLEALHKEANAAYKANDTSKYSFAEWSIMLDDECSKVLNNEDARIAIKEGTVFTMRRLLNPNRGAYAAGEYPVAEKSDAKGKINWTIEYAGKAGEYYMKSTSTGYYVTNISTSNVFLESKKQSDAIKFTVGYTDDGGVNFITVDNPDLTMGLSDGGSVTGLPLNETGAKWRVDIVEDNSLAFYTATVEELMAEANIKITEVLNLDSLQTMNIFNDGIIVKDNNLNTYALNLLDTYYEVTDNAEGADVVQLQKYVNTLRKQLADIEGKYIVTTPIVTKGERVVWYYIISNKSEEFASIYTGTQTSRKGRVEMSEEVTDDALWSFASTGKAGEYKLYNAGQQGFAYRQGTKNYIFTSAKEDYLPVTMVYDAKNGGLLLTAAGKNIYDSGTAVQLSTSKSYWRVQIALIENNKEVSDIVTAIEGVLPEATGNAAIYDLSGRRVEKPVRGIFIQNGKKVLVK
ncbi:MAG: M60 family metallopeptidase [Bacteroidaceae bacterium]|nr:M60 family metallopeptidase [Bacteroidaceae bacterium]